MWESCRFVFDPYESSYDWLVVIDDMPHIGASHGREVRALNTLACPQNHTLFITTEPSSITRYGVHFVRQFAHVLTSQEEKWLTHPGAIRSQTGNIWFYGKSYDEIQAMSPCPKTKLFSTVCSSKRQGHTVHALRYVFTQRLAQQIPSLEIFGHGVRFIARKADALDSYAFHLVIENHYAPHHWTEKLSDAFLGYAVPIYYGCPNVLDYFPRDSLILIDIHDFEGSLNVIREALTYDNYRRRLPAVMEARRRVLEDHNLPALINRTIADSERTEPPGETRPKRLYNRREMRFRHPQDFVPFAYWRMRNYLRCLWVNGGKRA